MFWFIIAGAAATVDLGIKWYVNKYVKAEKPVKLIKEKVILTRSKNKGAMLGFMKKQPQLLAGISIMFVSFIAGTLNGLTRNKKHTLSKIGFSLLLGGGFSNLYERLTEGKVTDYVQFNFGPAKFRKIVYNIGDFFIFIGSLLTAIGEFF